MSKIGRKPIDLNDVSVEIKGQEIHYKGPKESGVYLLPSPLKAHVEEKKLFLTAEKAEGLSRKVSRDINRIWGLNRALLSNKIQGASKDFEKQIIITGLGYKAAKSGNKLVFSLGYSHKIDFPLPANVVIDIDKSGQKLTVKSSDKVLVGLVASKIKNLRLPEPYKGTGIKLEGEVIARKAGKTKSA